MTADEEERLLWHFLSFARARGLALCASVQTSTAPPSVPWQQRQWERSWQPIAADGGRALTLIEGFRCWQKEKEKEEAQGDAG